MHLAVGFGMQCKAQSVPCGSATQAICNTAVRPKLTSQMCMLFLNEPLVSGQPYQVLPVRHLEVEMVFGF